MNGSNVVGEKSSPKVISLKAADGSSIRVEPQGAHVTSWMPSEAHGEQLFVSEQALFEGGSSIRGGVPICFPQFGNFGSIGKHGFARTCEWQHVETTSSAVVFTLKHSEETLKIWPHRFKALFTVTSSNTALEMTLSITNTGESYFEFTAALHTYFKISHLNEIAIVGLGGCSYWDNGTPFEQRQQEQSKTLRLTGALDRVYFGVEKPLILQDKAQNKTISMQGFNDVVVWNPGAEGVVDLSDLADHEFEKMICIEAAVVDQPLPLAAGETWVGRQIIILKNK